MRSSGRRRNGDGEPAGVRLLQLACAASAFDRFVVGALLVSIPAELGPWWMAAQTSSRWGRLGVWERLLEVAQERGVGLGMTFLDGTAIRAHQKAAGAARKGGARQSGTRARRSAARGAATARRHA